MESLDKHLNGEFTFEFRDGALLIFKGDGTELSAAEYFDLRAYLQNSYMHKKKREALLAIEPLCTSGTWVFPVNDRQLRNSGDCVYFLVSVDKFNLLKVGRTTDLHQRVKALSFKFRNPKVVAFVQTSEPGKLELGIHTQFAQARERGGEWFDAGTIYSFIDKFGRGL